MLRLGSKPTTIGTPVACPACRHPNPGINIWCERCRTPLDWNRPTPAVVTGPPAPAAAVSDRSAPRITRARPRLSLPAIAWPTLTLPRLTLPRLRSPHLPRPTAPRLPRVSLQRVPLPRVPRIVLVVLAILALLLIVPLAYVLLPAGRAAVDQQAAGAHLPSTNGAAAADTAQAAAIPGVEAKTQLPYRAGTCQTGTPCLTVVSETMGTDAAAVLFSTANSAARQCAGYVFRSAGRWRFLGAVCGLPDQLSPLVGHDATVHLPANCANVRERPSLKAAVVACLNGGATIHIDAGPTYADSRLWWHEPQGWIAHEFLTAP